MKKLLVILLFVPAFVQAQITIGVDSKIGLAYAYLTIPATTTTTVADTYYYLNGTFANEYIQDFAIVSDTLTYQGVNCWGLFMLTGTFTSDTNDTELTFALKKNGVIEENSEMTVLIESALKSIVPVPVVDVQWLEYGDRFSLWIKSDKPGAVITPVKINTVIWTK